MHHSTWLSLTCILCISGEIWACWHVQYAGDHIKIHELKTSSYLWLHYSLCRDFRKAMWTKQDESNPYRMTHRANKLNWEKFIRLVYFVYRTSVVCWKSLWPWRPGTNFNLNTGVLRKSLIRLTIFGWHKAKRCSLHCILDSTWRLCFNKWVITHEDLNQVRNPEQYRH